MGDGAQPGGQRIAVVGGGVSGLVSAHLLCAKHEVTVFEAGASVGGHTNTVTVDDPQGPTKVDTGFIVFNERNYPLFTSLMARLGVESQPSDMSFSVSCDATGYEYNGSSVNQLFARRRNVLSLSHWRMLRDIARFNKDAERLDQSGDASTVEGYARVNGFSDAFLERYLVPIGASIWSSPTDTFRAFPIRFVIDFLRNHGMLQVKGRPQWRVIKGGSESYLGPLTAPFADRIRTGAPVDRVRRDEGGVEIRVRGGGPERFDHVVLACHSDQALGMLETPTEKERVFLGSFPYQENETVLHTDTSLLPKRRRAWASWNYKLRTGGSERVAITYHMNTLQSLATRTQYCVTLNETERIDPAKIVRRFTYHHPVFTQERDQVQARHGELIGPNRTSLCGAYWGYGFHEDGVRSGVRVAEHFGCAL